MELAKYGKMSPRMLVSSVRASFCACALEDIMRAPSTMSQHLGAETKKLKKKKRQREREKKEALVRVKPGMHRSTASSIDQLIISSINTKMKMEKQRPYYS